MPCGHTATEAEAQVARQTKQCAQAGHAVTSYVKPMRPSLTVEKQGGAWKGDVMLEYGAIMHDTPQCGLVFNPSTTQKVFGEDTDEIVRSGRECPHCAIPFTAENTRRITVD